MTALRSISHGSPRETAIASDIGGRRWFVVETQPRKEGYAQENLVRQSFKSFCPRFPKTRRHARKVETVLAPLFPGYIFVELDRRMDSWHSINGTFGVRRLVGSHRGEPEPMPEPIMDAILARCAGERVIQVLPSITAGQRVRLSSGPFAECLAEVESLDDKGRVKVLMDILGGQASIVVPSYQLDIV